jgi:membrane protein required for colicin V production
LNQFDIIVLVLLGASAVIGFVRGAVREVMTVAAFLIAIAAAIFGLRLSGPLARAVVHPAWLGDTVAVLGVFFVIYTLLRIVSGGLSRRLHHVPVLGAADRMVGSGLGLARGLVVLGVFNLAIHLVPPAAGLPGWIQNAKLYPLSAKCADVVRAVGPHGSDVARRLAPELERAVHDGVGEPSAGGQSDKTSYDDTARKGLDDVAEKTR